MKIVINKSTNLASFLFEDIDSVVLTKTQMEAPNLVALDTGYDTHEIVSGNAPTQPLLWVPNALSYIKGEWAIADQELYDALLPQTEIAHQRSLKSKAAVVRAERNGRLSATDWRFRSDMTPSQDWIDYCQALRDITKQDGFPFEVIWPVAP